jgi:hypothetical protein
VQLIAFGQSPVGVIAIGQVPTGFIAIGQVATGVIAIGQLARGVIAVGQLALGLLAFGQLAVGVGWAGGMLSAGAVRGPSLLGYGAFGDLGLRDLLHGRLRRFEPRPRRRHLMGATLVGLTAALVWFAALGPLIDELRHHDEIEVEQPRVLR